MILWMMAGVGARAFASEFHGTQTAQLMDHSCCKTAHPSKLSERSGADHDSGPQESHHHHHDCGCQHALPLSVEGDLFWRLPVPDFYRLEISGERESAPESPCLQTEKPPLI
jgi:hypothetical protein